MKQVFLSTAALIIAISIAVSSCNQAGTNKNDSNAVQDTSSDTIKTKGKESPEEIAKTPTNSAIDTLSIVEKIHKQIDSLQALTSDDRKKTVIRDEVEDRPLHNYYYYDNKNNLIKVEVEYYDGGSVYSISNGKIICLYDANEAGEGSIYVIDNKAFCEAANPDGNKIQFFPVADTGRNWEEELKDLIRVSKTKPKDVFPESSKKFEVAGIDDDQSVYQFMSDLKYCDNCDDLAKYTDLEIDKTKCDKILAFLHTIDYNETFVSWRGVMLGDGEIYINLVENSLKVTTINID